MCPSRIIDKKMMTVYGDKQSSFEKLLEKDSCSSIHERNNQILATEMYKLSKGMPPPHQHPSNLRHNAEFLQLFLNSVYCGTESISHFGPKIWSMVPETYKDK